MGRELEKTSVIKTRLMNDDELNEAIRLDKNRNYPVVKDNRLIQKTRYSLTLSEQKILLHLIQRIKPNVEKFEYFEFSIKEYLKITGEKKGGKTYKEIAKDLKTLSDKSFYIQLENDGDWKTLVRWIDKVKLIDNKDNSRFKVKFDDDLRPYLLGMQSFFTEYNYFYVMSMRSQYSIRLYELLKSYQNVGGQIFTLEELKSSMLTSGKYEKWAMFKRDVLEIATKEINLLTDIDVSYEALKKGRSVHEVAFYVTAKEKNKLKKSREEVYQRLSK